jgi:hypothetical protein
MKTKIKKLFPFLLLLSATLLNVSCEKDIYEDAIVQKPQGKINYVNINEVPLLIP